ncbi:MAG: hypothetical protein SFV54_21690 [Bryobacteraceae bacterium]|nr:hypothetical protein [Bryobacteraceae bacterium]
MRAAPLLLAALALAGCGRYADFSLPAPGGGSPRDVRWTWEERSSPVLDTGAPDTLNPSVVFRDGLALNYFSVFDGSTWHTELARAADGTAGLAWTREARVLSPLAHTWESSYIAANGHAIVRGGEVLYWYQAGPKGATRIGFARSRDGRSFARLTQPVLDLGPRGAWDEISIGDPYVIEAGGTLYLYYLGQDRARRQRLGVARSPDGIRWEKLRANPVLELGEDGAFDENGLGEPAIWVSDGWYWMLYTGRDRKEFRRLGLARSRDGVRWERLPHVFSGAQPWNAKVLCDPTVHPTPDGVRVWFGGGDVASPDENLHGKIGFALLRPER